MDRYVIFPKKGNKYFNLLKVGLKYRKEKFDCAISAKIGPMKLMNFFLFAIGAKQTIAYVDGGWTSCLVNQNMPFDPHAAASLHQSLKTVKLLGYETVDEAWYPKLSIPDQLLAKYPSPFSKRPVILLSASTTNATSRIDPIKYAKLVNRLYEAFPFSLLLVGEKKR